MAAIKGQGATLSVATAAASPVTITGATAANPVVITATNTYSAGDIVVITGVVGMTQLNNRAFVVTSPSGSSFSLKGEDGTSYTAYSSGGTSTKQTMTAVGQVTDVKGFDGQASEIDTTHLLSPAKEFQLGLEDFGNVTLSLFLASGDTGQAKMRSLKSSATSAAYSLTLADGETAAFMAFVKQFGFDGVKPDGAVTCPCTLRVTNRPAWFA